MTTTPEADGEQILKQDSFGRVLISRERREMLLDEFEASGMSGMAFARRVRVKYPTFAYWVKHRRLQRMKAGGAPQPGAGTAGSCRWVEVVAGNPAPQATAALVVFLVGGARMELRDSAGITLAAELIGKLAGGRGC